MSEHQTRKLNPVIYFFLGLILPIKILNHERTVSKWVSISAGILPVAVFLVIVLFPPYLILRIAHAPGDGIINLGLTLLIYMWAFYAAGFLILYMMNRKVLNRPKTLEKLLHDYGVVALFTQFLLIAGALTIVIMLFSPGSPVDLGLIPLFLVLVITAIIYLLFMTYIFSNYLREAHNRRKFLAISVFWTLQLIIGTISISLLQVFII